MFGRHDIELTPNWVLGSRQSWPVPPCRVIAAVARQPIVAGKSDKNVVPAVSGNLVRQLRADDVDEALSVVRAGSGNLDSGVSGFFA